MKNSSEQALLHHQGLVMDHVSSMLAYWDRDLLCRYANRAYEVWFGADPKGLIGTSIRNLLGPDLFALNECYILGALRGETQEFERIVPGPDGIRRHSLARYMPHMVDGVVHGFMVEVTNVTRLKVAEAALQAEIAERKNREAQLLQSEKLASIGQLAAGLAHEINNPIGYVSSNLVTLEGYVAQLLGLLAACEGGQSGLLSTARDELAFLRDDIPALIRESKQGLAQVRQIVLDLKDFAHIDSTQAWQPADLHQGIDSTLNLLASRLRGRAEIVKEYGRIPDIECLPSQLNQVAMNLLLNAADALGETGGRITLRTGVEGIQVWLEVEDNGCGIAPDALPRIFDPFFTTKPVGQGTGLGLSMSYGIVQRHHGRIEVQSVVGRGTTVRVLLPLRQPPGAAPPGKIQEAESSA
jgi:PAS domain S-box-containing protein